MYQVATDQTLVACVAAAGAEYMVSVCEPWAGSEAEHSDALADLRICAAAASRLACRAGAQDPVWDVSRLTLMRLNRDTWNRLYGSGSSCPPVFTEFLRRALADRIASLAALPAADPDWASLGMWLLGITQIQWAAGLACELSDDDHVLATHLLISVALRALSVPR
jgi:hypothetical protein